MDVDRARDTIATEVPRRLRLDEMLRELGARDSEPRVRGSEPPAAEMPEPDRRAGITIGELVDNADEAGFGFLIGVLSLIAIPFVGLSTPFGLAVALFGAQLAVGRHRPWLPARTRRRELSMTMLDRVLALLHRRMKWLTRSARPRHPRLVTPRLAGMGVVLLGLGLALPIPIPGSNLVFLVPLIVYAVGLLENDGIWVLLGHGCTLVDMVLLVAFGATVLLGLEHAWHWLF